MDDITRESTEVPYPAFAHAVIEACKDWKAGAREYPEFAGPAPDGCEKWLTNE